MDTLQKQRTSAYRVGFLAKLAEMGVTPDEFYQRARPVEEKKPPGVVGPVLAGAALGGSFISPAMRQKRAFLDPAALLGATATGLGDIGKGALGAVSSLIGPAVKTTLLAPPAIGAGLGAASALMESPTDQDIQTLRNMELVRLYEDLTRQVNLRRQAGKN